MIKTKNSTDADATVQKQLGYEEAAVKGKLYNPITGKELVSLITKRIFDMLTSYPAEIDATDARATKLAIEHELLRHPSFDTEVKSYPKANISILLKIGPGYLKGNTSLKLARYLINIAVTQFPSEEHRGFSCSIDYTSSHQTWDREPLAIETEWNLDDIPPDASRILADLPVPTPTRTPGSGPSGEATVTDELKPAGEKQREAVVKQFGNTGTIRKESKK